MSSDADIAVNATTASSSSIRDIAQWSMMPVAGGSFPLPGGAIRFPRSRSRKSERVKRRRWIRKDIAREKPLSTAAAAAAVYISFRLLGRRRRNCEMILSIHHRRVGSVHTRYVSITWHAAQYKWARNVRADIWGETGQSSQSQHKQKWEKCWRIFLIIRTAEKNFKLRPSRHPPTNWWSERIFPLAFVLPATPRTLCCAVLCVCALCAGWPPPPRRRRSACHSYRVNALFFSILFFTPNIIPIYFFPGDPPAWIQSPSVILSPYLLYVSGDKRKT
jgi:hypothetical protein